MQGHTNLMYPWGDSPDPALVPAFSSGRAMPPPDDVDAHPGGASWCGAEELVGNVYTWTRSGFMYIYFLCILNIFLCGSECSPTSTPRKP